MAAAPDLDALAARLGDLTLADEHRLSGRLASVQRLRDPGRRRRDLTRVVGQVDRAEARIAARRAARERLRVTYPPELPVSQRRDDLAAAISDHQVVVVAGETGSGKTTQLPKICLDLGRGVRGTIGHTQPRRLAARTVADRIAEELRVPLGGPVGWKVRFDDHVGPDTLVKVMTDGILLAELPHDRELRAYDTVIVDEAHERSLTIDYLLGHLARLLPRRPDLKVVITSATIDPDRFAKHFSDVLDAEVPVVEVSGRTYPVEVRYRPYGATNPVDPRDDRDQVQAVLDAVDELALEPPGDVLVFLSGEREIRDTAEALRGRHLRGTEILPLYARLSVAEQHRVFAPHAGRRIVLATNVAETSLTVPGIRYVVDPGTARISRYSTRLKVQRLPIEPVSQASARQRAGRCGRVAAGICVRLYSEEDFFARPAFTEPEVQRTNLASVILSMTALGLGDVASFPFVDPPDRRAIRDGVELLRELGALEAPGGSGDVPAAPATTVSPERPPAPAGGGHRLTGTGRRLAELPVDPRLARMVLEAGQQGCVADVLVIAAALSIQDPRERPTEQQAQADEKHRRFADPSSDFAAYLNLWRYLQEQQRTLGSSAFRRLCRTEFLHYLRVREWQDVHGQLRSAARSVGLDTTPAPDGTAADPQQLTTALLAGLLSHVGTLDEREKDSSTGASGSVSGRRGRGAREYLGARGARFAPWPGSALARRPPAWVVAGELVETSRLWGRVLARIDPAWVEPLAGHLLKRTYSEPHWSRKSGATLAYERVTLYGLPIVARRRVPYAGIDPVVARELFVQHALVEGDWDTHHRFLAENRTLLAEVEELEERTRRRDIVVGPEELYGFYDARVPVDVVSARHFDAWWKGERRHRPDLLTFTREMLVSGVGEVREEDYPGSWRHGEVDLALTYVFAPGEPADGVTARVPLPLLDAAAEAGLDWQVPGLRTELATALVRSLPKVLRRSFVPAPDTAVVALSSVRPYEGSLTTSLAAALTQLRGVEVESTDFDLDKVPPHLLVTVRVEDEQGRELAQGKDVAALRRQLAPTVARQVAAAADDLERTGLTDWPAPRRPRAASSGPATPGRPAPTGDEIPARVQRTAAGHVVTGYPALVDDGGAVALRVLPSAAAQRRAMPRGTRALLLAGSGLPSVRSLTAAPVARLSARERMALATSPYGSVDALLADCRAAAVDVLVAQAGGPAWDAAGFARLREHVRAGVAGAVGDVVRNAAAVLAEAVDVRSGLTGRTSLALLPALTDVRTQVDELLPAGFVSTAGAARLPDLVRYLRAASRRLEVLPTTPQRDTERMALVHRVRSAYDAAVAALPPERRADDDVVAVRWLLEELRVSLFAQTLGTAVPVSEPRLLRAVAALSASR